MTNISYEGDCVIIDGEEVQFPENIKNVVAIDDVVLVHIEQGSMDPRNLVALDGNGDELWRIPPLKRDKDDTAFPVDGISKNESRVQAYSWGERYELDPQTGEVEYLGWVR